MDIFGPVWENHTERLRENWNKTVAPDDTVVVPGDISWAMHFEEARADFRFIESLNGKKILLKGNHDYWWQTNAKNRNFLESEGLRTITILFNDAVRAEDFIVCGTRGWFVDSAYSPEDDKIVEREAGRYRLSFQAAEKLQKQYGDLRSINIDDNNTRQFERIARKYRVKYKVYRLEKGKYQIFFKAPNDEAMQAAFKAYAVQKLKKAQRPSVLQKLQKFKELVKAPFVGREKRKELER